MQRGAALILTGRRLSTQLLSSFSVGGLLIIWLMVWLFSPLTAKATFAPTYQSDAERFQQILGGLPVNPQSTIDRIIQIERMAETDIRNAVFTRADPNQARQEAASIRYRAVSAMDVAVTSFKANLRSAYAAGLPTNQAQAQQVVDRVNIAYSEAIVQLDRSIAELTRSVNQAMQLPDGYYRANLPSSARQDIFSGQYRLPVITQTYLQSQNQYNPTIAPYFNPVSPVTANHIFAPQQPQNRTAAVFNQIGQQFGQIFAFYQVFKETKIRVSKLSSFEKIDYRFSLNGGKTKVDNLVLTSNTQPQTIRIEPGVYTALYQPINPDADPNKQQPYSSYVFTINPGDVYCFQLPVPPLKCQ